MKDEHTTQARAQTKAIEDYAQLQQDSLKRVTDSHVKFLNQLTATQASIASLADGNSFMFRYLHAVGF